MFGFSLLCFLALNVHCYTYNQDAVFLSSTKYGKEPVFSWRRPDRPHKSVPKDRLMFNFGLLKMPNGAPIQAPTPKLYSIRRFPTPHQSGYQDRNGIIFRSLPGGAPSRYSRQDGYFENVGPPVPAPTLHKNTEMLKYRRPMENVDFEHEQRCLYNPNEFSFHAASAITNAVMFDRITGISCEKCMDRCSKKQSTKWACQSITYDHAWKICDLFAVTASGGPFILVSYNERDYFEYLHAGKSDESQESENDTNYSFDDDVNCDAKIASLINKFRKEQDEHNIIAHGVQNIQDQTHKNVTNLMVSNGDALYSIANSDISKKNRSKKGPKYYKQKHFKNDKPKAQTDYPPSDVTEDDLLDYLTVNDNAGPNQHPNLNLDRSASTEDFDVSTTGTPKRKMKLKQLRIKNSEKRNTEQKKERKQPKKGKGKLSEPLSEDELLKGLELAEKLAALSELTEEISSSHQIRDESNEMRRKPTRTIRTTEVDDDTIKRNNRRDTRWTSNICGSRHSMAYMVFENTKRLYSTNAETFSKTLPGISMSECVDKCSLSVDHFECKSIMHHDDQCILSASHADHKSHTPQLVLARGQNYIEKICVPTNNLNGHSPMFYAVQDYLLFGFVEQVETAKTLEECVYLCVSSRDRIGYKCTSAMWYGRDGEQNCLLNSESRYTRPHVFTKESVPMVYFELAHNPGQPKFDELRLKDEPLMAEWTRWSTCSSPDIQWKYRYKKCELKDIRQCQRETQQCYSYSLHSSIPGGTLHN